MSHTITAPAGALIQSAFKGGSMKVHLSWNPGFSSRWSSRFNNAQKFIDSEVLRLCSPLVPFQTGNLMRSGTSGTSIGSGEVRYIAPYARQQYYNTAETRPYNPNRGGKWFERMKTAYKDQILRNASNHFK